MSSLDMQDQIEKVEAREKIPEQRLGRCLKQPFTALNSGPRKLMFSLHQDQRIQLNDPEPPLISTGAENEFARYASSYIEAKDDFDVLAKIEKFEFKKGDHYWLIVKNVTGNKQEAGILDVIEKKNYVHTTEDYGFALDNSYLNDLYPGSRIKIGDRVQCSDSIDDYGNIKEGKNLLTSYLSDTDTEEDGIKLSETAAKALGSKLYHHFQIILNDNDIMLNLYADPYDKDDYSVMPEIGDDVKDGILCAIRRQTNAEALYSQAWDQLKKFNIGDEKYIVNGTVIDLDILVNNPDQFENSPYHRQLKDYYYNKLRYSADVVNFIEEYRSKNSDMKMTYELSRLYDISKKTIARACHIKDKVYSGTIINVTVKEILPMAVGDKMCNRYGGKSVVSKIVPDSLMPRLENGDIIDVSNNKGGTIGRLNMGQLVEYELNARSSIFLEHVLYVVPDRDLAFEMIIDFIRIISPNVAQFLEETVASLDSVGKDMFIESYIRDEAIALPLMPLSENITIDTLNAIDIAYPWIKQRYYMAPLIDSNGKVRYVRSMRPIVVGKEYYIRLEQYARKKFSVTSISTVNIRNENSKSKAANLYKSAYPDTPVRFGGMEVEDLEHMDANGDCNVIIFVMMYSSSPTARRNFVKLFSCDPIEHNIMLDENATSRGAETFHVFMKQLGYRLLIERHLIEPTEVPFDIIENKETPFDIKTMAKEIPFDIDDKAIPVKRMIINEDGSITNKIDKNTKYNAIPFNIICSKDSEK